MKPCLNCGKQLHVGATQHSVIKKFKSKDIHGRFVIKAGLCKECVRKAYEEFIAYESSRLFYLRLDQDFTTL